MSHAAETNTEKAEKQISSGKIQGDSRKFLDRLKSYFGSQISSQSLNEVYIYQLQPKSATKGEFFSYIFVFDCFESANEANEVLLGKRPCT